MCAVPPWGSDTLGGAVEVVVVVWWRVIGGWVCDVVAVAAPPCRGEGFE